MHLIEIINDNSKFEKQFIDGLSFDYFAFNRMHRAQLIQAAKEDKEKERAATKDAQNKQSDVSYYWHFNSNSGQGHFLNGVVNSHGNQPPTTPRPTPPTRRTPAEKLDLRKSFKLNFDLINYSKFLFMLILGVKLTC